MNNYFFKHKIYGYGICPKYTTEDAAKQAQSKSAVFKRLRGLFIQPEHIFIDNANERTQLEHLLLDVAATGDTIVILNRKTLGTGPDFAEWWKKIVLARQLNLLIPDYSNDSSGSVDYFSTIDFSFVPYPYEQIQERSESLENNTDNSTDDPSAPGRRPNALSKQFIDSYWSYQSFSISLENAYRNAGVSKQTFFNMSKRYENTKKFLIDLENHPETHELPHRGTLPKDIESLFQCVEYGQIPLDKACKALNIPEMSQLQYHRYLLQARGGRALQFQLEKQHGI